MSTSDAAELELRVGGGETATPQSRTARRAVSTAARDQQDEIFREKFKQENHDKEIPTGPHCHPSAIGQEEAHKALISRADVLREGEAAHCGDLKVQIQRTSGPTFTSCLLFRLHRNPGLDKPKLSFKKNLEPLVLSLTDTQGDESENNGCQANEQTSLPDTATEVASDSPISERTLFPAKQKEEVIPETTTDLSHSFSNREFGPHECNGLHILPCGPLPRTVTRSVELEDIKDHQKHTDLVELSNPGATMLSSTVVTVLAPHWNGRLRRSKRPEGTGSSEAQGNLQDVTNTPANRAHESFQETLDRLLTDRSQAQLRMQFLGTRRNTVGWSTKSGPASLDYESKRKVIHTVSLDVNAGRMDNRKMDAGALSPVSTAVSPVSPLPLDPNEQRNPQTVHQGLSSSSSKPTTSSLLLSLRRFNSNGRNPNAASTLSEIKPSPLSSSSSERDGKLFATPLSQTFLNNNGQERSNPLLSPSSTSYRTTETGPILSPSSFSQRDRNVFETRLISASPMNKDVEGTPVSQQSQTMNRTQSSLSCPKQAFPIRGPSERQENCRVSDKTTNKFSESPFSSPRHSPYDRSALIKTHSLPRRTTLTSTSWWKQVTQEGISPQSFNDAMNITEKLTTPSVPPCNDNKDLASPSPSSTDNIRFSSQIPDNRDNTTESVRKGNMNLTMNAQGGTHNLRQRNAEDSPDYGSNLNREPQKTHSLPDVLIHSKISRATEQTALSHPKDLSRHSVNNSSITANITELPPTLLNPKSTNTPTESSSKYNNSHCTSKTNSSPTYSHSDSQKFTNPPFSLATANTSQALTSKATSGLSRATNTKTSSSVHSQPVVSQTNIHITSYTGSSSQPPKFASATPLGFERSYPSFQKPLHSKTVSNLIPAISASTKRTTYSFATGSNPAATTAPSPILTSPPAMPSIASSPTTTVSSILTPPATPIITSPNYSDTPKEGSTFLSSPESDPKKPRPCVQEKRERRVTWEDSVDLKHPEPVAVEKPDPSQAPASSRSPQSVKVSSIFSFLRSSSPTTNSSPLSSPSLKTSSIQVEKGVKYRSLSSDSADLASRERQRSKQRPSDTMMFDQGRQERTLSEESGTVQCCTSAPLSLPPDFSSSYKLRYSSPPYSTLMSSRSVQGETKTVIPRSPLFQQSQSNYTPCLSMCTDPFSAKMTLTTSKPPLSPNSLPQPLFLPFQYNTATQGNGKCVVSKSDQVDSNRKNNGHDHHNGQVLLVDNRLHKAHKSSSTCVTETLVYSIKSKVDTATAAPKNITPEPLQHTANTQVSVETKLSQQSHREQRKEPRREPHHHSDQSSSGSSSTESQPSGEGSNRRMKESVLGKSRFFSVESNSDQNAKRSRFALKKSVSTPNSSLSRSESERASKTNNKMDQVLNRLKQTFSTRRSDDDVSFPWKWKKASQTPSVNGSRVSDVTVESTKKKDKAMALKDNDKGMGDTNKWTPNRYTIIPPSAARSTGAGGELYIWSDKSTPVRDDQNVCAEHFTIHSPTVQQFDFYKDNRTDYKPPNQFHPCRDPSPGKNPHPSADYPTPFRKSSSIPRSPFSPFSSLSPVSSLTSPDVTDDSVFYSPKLQRRRESSSPCEPGEGISLGSSRRSRASTGPPSTSPGSKESVASSYADLKYGIEPGRSFSVSSVLSCRPSGPGRISTGSRHMSVGDLFESGNNLDQWSDWTTGYDCQPSKDHQMSYFNTDPGKMRSRSLPRSLTRRLANWSSEVSASPPVATTTSKQTRLWSPNMNTPFPWDTEGPPTPPPTPPLSPVSRRMSKPPNLSSPTFPSSPGSSQQVDSQSPRGLLPSRGYISSLSTFEESTDSGSDTTTDDEYYLETGEDEEKETEL